MKKLTLLLLLSFTLTGSRGETFSLNEFHVELPAGETYTIEQKEPLIGSSFEFGLCPAKGGEKQVWHLELSRDEAAVNVDITSALSLSSVHPAFEYKRDVKVNVADGENTETYKFSGAVAEEGSPFFIKFSFEGNRMDIEGGTKQLKLLGTQDCRFVADRAELRSMKASEIYRASLTCKSVLKEAYTQKLTAEQLSERLSGALELNEGEWKFLDEETDTDFARRGGNYRLASLKNEKGHYIMYYLEGDKTNADFWQPGMVKAIMTPSELAGNYDAVWLDAFGEPLSEGVNVYFEGNTLIVAFPYEKTKLRFVKAASCSANL